MTFPPIIPFDGNDAEAFIRVHTQKDAQDQAEVKAAAEGIVEDVRKNGNQAVLAYTKRFDGADLSPDTLKVSENEMQAAYREVSPAFVEIIKKAIARIRRFHDKQLRNGWLEPFDKGEWMGQLIRPVASCGVYVPGGTAAYPSSLLMLAVPAMAAGVERIIVCTPCGKDGRVSPSIIVAACETGIKEIYKIGGAQAIAAMAFGTETVPRVDKIVGPGNIYVMLAKRAVYGYVGIDSMAGPSEIVIIADESADKRHVAADMLSQAEHDVRAASVLITPSKELAEAVQEEIVRQSETLSRREIIAGSLKNNGKIFITKDLTDAVRLSDAIAPEHLAINTADPMPLLSYVQHAGAVFLGHYTPEPLGDYMAGPSHVLPTETTARFFSPVTVDDFLKKTSVLSFDRDAMNRLKDDVMRFAEEEGLTAHANALRVRA